MAESFLGLALLRFYTFFSRNLNDSGDKPLTDNDDLKVTGTQVVNFSH